MWKLVLLAVTIGLTSGLATGWVCSLWLDRKSEQQLFVLVQGAQMAREEGWSVENLVAYLRDEGLTVESVFISDAGDGFRVDIRPLIFPPFSQARDLIYGELANGERISTAHPLRFWD